MHTCLALLALLAKLGGYINEAHFDCHDILMLDKSPIKRRQRPDMTFTVDWDVKQKKKKKKKKKKLYTSVLLINTFL